MRVGLLPCFIILTTALNGCAVSRPLSGQAIAVTCQLQEIDTSRWVRKAVDQAFTVLLPAEMAPDTSGLARLEFYHGGGRFLAGTQVFEYGFLDPGSGPQIARPSDWLPGFPACFSTPPDGWEARMAGKRGENGEFRVSAWFRRPERPQSWIFTSVVDRDSTELRRLTRILASVAPLPSFWRP
jgi:hypothetical protein